MMWIAYAVLAIVIGWQVYSRWRIESGRASEKVCPTCGGFGLVQQNNSRCWYASQREEKGDG